MGDRQGSRCRVRVIVGIVGSRRGVPPGRVREWVGNLAEKYPEAAVVSGGCDFNGRCVDVVAETEALRCGLRVASFRPEAALPWADLRRPEHDRNADEDAVLAFLPGLRVATALYLNEVRSLAGRFTTVLYEFWPDEEYVRERVRGLGDLHASFREAALARNVMIARYSDRLVAFHAEDSPGTRHTIGEASRLGRPVHVARAPSWDLVKA